MKKISIPDFLQGVYVAIEDMILMSKGKAETSMGQMWTALQQSTKIILPHNGEIYGTIFDQQAEGLHVVSGMKIQEELDSLIALPDFLTSFFYTVATKNYTANKIGLIMDGKQHPDYDGSPEFAVTVALFQQSILGRQSPGDSWIVYPYVCSFQAPVKKLPNGGMMGVVKKLEGFDWVKDKDGSMEHASNFAADFYVACHACTALRAGGAVVEVQERNRHKRRKLENQQPKVSYHILQIPGTRYECVTVGTGSHASPRLHIRRAHIRRYKRGLVSFVRRCLVGDPAKGFVDKDYRIDKEL